MPVQERRHHLRIEDHIHFDYRIITPGLMDSDITIPNILPGERSDKNIEALQYIQDIDSELAQLTQTIGLTEPTIAHYLNLLNAKIDCLSRHFLMADTPKMRKVNIGLGGMAFKTPDLIKEKTRLKIILYTRPNMIPITVDATVVYCQYQNESNYRTSVEFHALTHTQEQLLTHHILQAQIKNKAPD